MTEPKTTLVDGGPVPEDGSHTKLKPNGQQQDYVVLSAEERAKGFVRPVRRSYVHVGVRPAHPTRPLTPEEQERFKDYKYVAYEEYPPGQAASGRRTARRSDGARDSLVKFVRTAWARRRQLVAARFRPAWSKLRCEPKWLGDF